MGYIYYRRRNNMEILPNVGLSGFFGANKFTNNASSSVSNLPTNSELTPSETNNSQTTLSVGGSVRANKTSSLGFLNPAFSSKQSNNQQPHSESDSVAMDQIDSEQNNNQNAALSMDSIFSSNLNGKQNGAGTGEKTSKFTLRKKKKSSLTFFFDVFLYSFKIICYTLSLNMLFKN